MTERKLNNTAGRENIFVHILKTAGLSLNHYREHYNNKTKQIVRDAYKHDIKLFNYNF